MMKILMLSLLISGGAFAQSKADTAEAINAQLPYSDGFEIKTNLDPFMDMKLWDKDTQGNKIIFTNTQEALASEDSVISPKDYKIELNYEDVIAKKKILNTVYSERVRKLKGLGSIDKSLTKLKDNKIQEVTGCSTALLNDDEPVQFNCSTVSRSVCEYIAKRSENSFNSKAQAQKCAAYISDLIKDLAKDQESIIAELQKSHQENVDAIKSRDGSVRKDKPERSNHKYSNEDVGLHGLLKKNKIESTQVNLLSYLSEYQKACSVFKMNEKENGKTRSLHKDSKPSATVAPSTEED